MKLNLCWSLLSGCYMYSMLLMIVTPKGSRSLVAANKLWLRDESHWCYGFQLWIIPSSKRYFSSICCQISIMLLCSDKWENPPVLFYPTKRLLSFIGRTRIWFRLQVKLYNLNRQRYGLHLQYTLLLFSIKWMNAPVRIYRMSKITTYL